MVKKGYGTRESSRQVNVAAKQQSLFTENALTLTEKQRRFIKCKGSSFLYAQICFCQRATT